MINSRYLSAVSASALFCAAVPPAMAAGHAQPTDTENATPAPAAAEQEDDTTIVVTAQRREQSLQDVPVSMSVLSGDTLGQRAIVSLPDLASQVPNFIVVQTASSDQIQLRGFGAGTNPGFEQAVATFVDGAYRSRARSSRVALFDVERVEILRGPQTLFFGANAIAGAVSITSRRAGRDMAANASASYAVPDGEYNLEAGISLPIAEGLGVRAAGRVYGMDGYIENRRFGTDGPDGRTRQGRLSLNYESGGFSLAARYDIARVRDDGTQYEALNCPPVGRAAAGLCARALAAFPNLDDDLDRVTDQGTDTYSNLNLDEGVLVARYNFGPASIVSTTTLSEQNAEVRSELGPLPGLTVLGTTQFIPAQLNEQAHQFAQEIRVQSEADGPFSYMLGGYYEKQRLGVQGIAGNYFLAFATFPPLAGLVPANTRVISITDTRIRTETLSAFASVTFRPIEPLSITGGLRYSRVEKSGTRGATFGTGGYFADENAAFVPFSPAIQAAASTTLNVPTRAFPVGRFVDDAWMPSVILQYEFNNRAMAYASYTRGFLAGGYGGTTPDVFDPEYVDAFEIGARAQFFNRRLALNIAFFRSDYADLQEAFNTVTQAGTTLQVIANVADSRSEGIEFGASLRVTNALTLRGDVAYLRSRYLEYPNAPCNPIEAVGRPVPCTVDAAGRTRAYAPEWSGSFGADYRIPVGGNLELKAGATVRFTSSYFTQTLVSDFVRVDGYAKLDAQLSLGEMNDGRWTIALIGRNLTNTDNAVFFTYMPGAVGSVIGQADRPRSIALQVTASW
ncbi:MAG TPA: TonB-dependent receptor [Allosphingosinicella sp.]|nr:TonB-dependent receptor [Allosphingosinicella sp.]